MWKKLLTKLKQRESSVPKHLDSVVGSVMQRSSMLWYILSPNHVRTLTNTLDACKTEKKKKNTCQVMCNTLTNCADHHTHAQWKVLRQLNAFLCLTHISVIFRKSFQGFELSSLIMAWRQEHVLTLAYTHSLTHTQTHTHTLYIYCY